jgi:hypothetical protein
MAQLIIAILMLLTGGILLGDDLVTLEKTQTKDNQSVIAETSIKAQKTELANQEKTGANQNQASKRPTASFSSSVKGEAAQITLARLSEKNDLTADKDILRSPAIRAPPSG